MWTDCWAGIWEDAITKLMLVKLKVLRITDKKRTYTCIYSGAPPIWTPLGPSTCGRIIEVSSFQGLFIQHGCGLTLFPMM